MNTPISVELTQEEAGLIIAALDRAPLQGIGTARMVTVIAEKLGKAHVVSKVTGETDSVIRSPLLTAGQKAPNGAASQH